LSKKSFVRERENLIVAFLIGALLISCFIVSVRPIQPPVDTTTYYVQRTDQPSRLDPARAYDPASGELIQNLLQTLIWWNDKHPIAFAPGVGYDLTIADYSDLDQYMPVLCTEVPLSANGRIVINASGSYWRFTINTNALFQPWADHTGAIVPARNITTADVVYSFQRQVIYDSPYGPTWMWVSPAFGISSWRDTYGGLFETYGNGTFMHVADEITAATMIQNWCYAIGNDVYFHFTLPWAEGPLRQIFAQTWGGVVNPDLVKEYGGWDGLFTTGASDANMKDGWTNNYHWKPTSTRSELDTYKNPTVYGAAHGSKYSSFSYRLSGTGPYQFTSWNQTNKIWRIDYYPAYWKGWTQAGDKAGNYFHTVVWKEIDDWPTRKMLFLEGEFDVAVVPRVNMYDLLMTDAYTPVPGINLVYNIGSLSNDAMLFNMNIGSASSYKPYIGYPSHIGAAEPYFFNNTHMRRAFAWALNYTSYIADAYFGEALTSTSWWVDGLSPASYKNTSIVQRNLDLTQMQDELNQAIINGLNVSEAGFDVTLVYNIGNDQRLIAFNLIAQAFLSLGSKYHVNVMGVDWSVFLDAENNGYLSMYDVDWLADFVDPDNFCEPYQASWGNFMVSQGPPYPEDQDFVDNEIRSAMVESDFFARGAMYQDLQYRYWLDVPSFPLAQVVGRRWARDWVQGWYYNALFPGEYCYDLYKTGLALVNVDVKVVSISPTTPPYPIVSLRTLPNQVFSVTVIREDANFQIPMLLVAVGLKLTNQSNVYVCYANATYIVLAPGQFASVELTWDKSFPITHGNWSISAEANPINSNAFDTDRSDQTVSDGMVQVFGYGKGELRYIPEDLNQDGSVNTYDAILLSVKFGLTGPPGWIQADLMPDGIIDWFDALMMDRRMGWQSSNPTNPRPEKWPLELKAYPANFIVEVYSDYAVYSNTYKYNATSRQFSFDVTTEVDAFCNVTIDRILMSGNFTVYLDGASTPFEASTNVTCNFIYFTSTGLSHRIAIESTIGFLGDANGDGWVDIFDAIILSNAFNSFPGSPSWNARVDFNSDNFVDIFDAILLSNHYNEHIP